VISRSFEGLVSLEKGGVELVGTFDGGFEDGAAETVNFRARGIENEESLGGEGFGVEVGEGLSECAARFVGGDEGVHGVGCAEEFPCLVDEGLDGLVNDDAANGYGSRRSVGIDEFFELFSGGEGGVVDLGEVVVFGCEPEDGDMGMSGRGGLARAGNSRCGFEWGIEGTAEEADLLAGEYGSGSRTKRLD